MIKNSGTDEIGIIVSEESMIYFLIVRDEEISMSDGHTDSYASLRFQLFELEGSEEDGDPNQATAGVVIVAIVVGGTISGFCCTALFCMGIKGCQPDDDPADEKEREKKMLKELVEKRETLLLRKMDSKLKEEAEESKYPAVTREPDANAEKTGGLMEDANEFSLDEESFAAKEEKR